MDTLHIGQVITEPQTKDAIHMAVAPVTAGRFMFPGTHVEVDSAGTAWPGEKNIGIVDPFLKKPVAKGQKFWLFLYPGSIASLRHEWSHPSFKEKSKDNKSASEAWLRQYAARVMGPEYGDPFENLISDLKQRELIYRGHDCHGFHDVHDPELLFHHASIYLGQPVTQEQFEYFSCTC